MSDYFKNRNQIFNYLIQFKNLKLKLKSDHSDSSRLCWFDSIKDSRDDLTRLIFTEKSVILSLVLKEFQSTAELYINQCLEGELEEVSPFYLKCYIEKIEISEFLA